MSIRYWLFAVALGGCLIGSAVAEPEQSLPEQQRPPLQKAEEPDSNDAEPQNGQAEQTKDTGVAGVNVFPAQMTGDPERGDAKAKPANQPDDSSYLFWGEGLAQWGMAITGLLAFAVSIYAVCLLKGTLIVTQRTLKAAAKANAITGRAVREAAKSAERELRAYIHIKSANICNTLSKDTLPFVQIVWRNFGQTPGRRLIHFSIIRFAEPDFSDFRMIDYSWATMGDMAPGHDEPSVVPLAIWHKHKDRIAKGEIAVFVFGQLTYVDAFGAPRETNYRLKMLVDSRGIRDGRLIQCNDGNTST
ncbi:hypothetical protein [Nisaea sp.]|uniref:hypothetical protein n=1 Tax=Nisaea sp. TaxID=2024842 RepID=UPI003B529962